jgi:hypothetical protein
MDTVMTIANVAVMTVTPLLLMRFTALPFWACFLIGVPGGIAVFWLLLFSVLRFRSRPPSRK